MAGRPKKIKKAIIYGLRVIGEPEPFYVGSTERDPQVRLRAHCYGRKGANPFVRMRIAASGRKNIQIDVIDEVPVKRRYKREYQLINEYKARGVNLCNIQTDPKPPAWLKNREWEIREIVARIEPLASEGFTGAAQWMRRGADREIVWLKMSVAEGDVAPELFKRIQDLPWPKEFPSPIARKEVKAFCDLVSLNSHERREYYDAANIWNRKAS